MIEVTAWNNSEHHRSGAGYGLKVNFEDRQRFFKREWGKVQIELPDGSKATCNINKDSFWNRTCGELISADIGRYFLLAKIAPWVKGGPPTFFLIKEADACFKLVV